MVILATTICHCNRTFLIDAAVDLGVDSPFISVVQCNTTLDCTDYNAICIRHVGPTRIFYYLIMFVIIQLAQYLCLVIPIVLV